MLKIFVISVELYDSLKFERLKKKKSLPKDL